MRPVIVIALFLITASAAFAVIPPNAQLLPMSEWPMQPPGGRLTSMNSGNGGLHLVSGVYGCVSFDELPDGFDVICGYLDSMPLAPPGPPPAPGLTWMCTRRHDVLRYTVPFAQGGCGFFATSLLQNGELWYVPSAAELAAATPPQDYLRMAMGLPVEPRPSVPDPLQAEQRRAIQSAAESNFLAGLLTAVGLAICERAPILGACTVSGASRHLAAALLTQGVTGKLSLNAPSPDFGTIPQPGNAPAPSLSGNGLTPDEEQAMSQVIGSLNRLSALGTSIGESLSRAEGARQAGAIAAEQSQLESADTQMKAAGQQMAALVSQLAGLTSASTTANRQQTVTLSDITTFQNNALRGNLPAGLDSALGDLLSTCCDRYAPTREDVLVEIAARNPDTVLSLGASPGHLSRPGTLASLQGGASALQVGVPFSAAPPGCATDVSSHVAVLRGGFLYNRAVGRYQQRVTLQNTGDSFVARPMALVLSGLPADVSLVNRTAFTACSSPLGLPYVEVDQALAPGSAVTVLLEFSNPGNLGIGYTAKVLAGSGGR